jgi:hypothetical protein
MHSSQGMSRLSELIFKGSSQMLAFSSTFYINVYVRFHYDEYLERCEAKGIEAKAHPPDGWKPKT